MKYDDIYAAIDYALALLIGVGMAAALIFWWSTP